MTSPPDLSGPSGTEAVDRRLSDGWTLDTHRPDRSEIRRADGLVTRAHYLDDELFCVTHSPSGHSRGSVVMCSPLYAEAVRNQRRELVLGWELSAAGFTTVRFHYLGTGHSAGATEDLRLDTLVRDALRVAASAAGNDAPIAFAGTRIGGFVAARAAAEYPGSAIALWAPITDLAAYLTELRRARMIGLLREGKRGDGTSGGDGFRTDGLMDVVGYPVSRPLYESLTEVTIADLVEKARPRSVLAVQMSRRTQLRPEMSELVDRWRTSGLDASAAVASYDEAWWFGAAGYSVVEVDAGGLDTVPVTVDFLREKMG